MNRLLIKGVVKDALYEDLAKAGDITTQGMISEKVFGRAEILTGEPLVLCGLPFVQEVFNQLDPQIHVISRAEEGDELDENTVAIEVKGRLEPILIGERTALNFLGWLSGIATYTRRIVEKAQQKGIVILDTRKTIPTLRVLEKYAVRVGGAKNHRFGLYDGILIKDNHIKAIGSVTEAIKKIKDRLPHNMKIEVEVANLQELKEAKDAGVDIVLLDNMSPDEIKEAVSLLVDSGIEIEVSGGINIENIEEYLIEGVNYISSGAITHSSRWMNFSLEVKGVWK